MAFLNFRRRPDNALESGGRKKYAAAAEEVSCPNCHRTYKRAELALAARCCPNCGHHFSMTARERVDLICDKASFAPLFETLVSADPLDFPYYQDKLAKARAASGENEAVICGTASIGGADCALFIMEGKFMMGSMSAAVGERLTRLFEYATAHRLPVVGYTVSGGARMQEGLYSLMQMAKVSGAVARHSAAGLFYLPILTSPTTGGVTASFAMEGDIILAEPGAIVGFAGARVIEQTTRKSLPKGFQTAEFLLAHGFVDAIVPRAEQRITLARLLSLHAERTHS
ncbi:MAG: acetyl-CoA carboxylase, carboxyltransferase subunit beta [Peptococcaceae bacterium]|nr:acetyl-CoA carboxylase, carboxyltransferase subunit beta [Peptococcaceae bacterium]